MGPLLAVIVHASLAYFLVWMSLEGAGSEMRSSGCVSWWDPDGRRHDDPECLVWVRKFHVLLWVYLVALLVLGSVSLIPATLLSYNC
jgi:hypothetical protein